MTTVGIIGSGMIGGTVARLSVAAGYHVVVSNSRGPETLAELAAELGPLATAGTAGQAAEAGDLVLVSVPATTPSTPGRWPTAGTRNPVPPSTAPPTARSPTRWAPLPPPPGSTST
jgi:8-hydroxy-5-deazaflavin:NADPH oxidoreductase